MNIPKNLFYTKEHEWVKVENSTAKFGITEFAANQMGDIVFIELPEKGENLVQFENFGVLESVKTVSDIYAPLSGKVIDRNPDLLSEIDGTENENVHLEYINEDPFEKGWMLKIEISDKDELNKLLSPENYEIFVREQGGE